MKARLPGEREYSLFPLRRCQGPQVDKEAGDESKREAKEGSPRRSSDHKDARKD